MNTVAYIIYFFSVIVLGITIIYVFVYLQLRKVKATMIFNNAIVPEQSKIIDSLLEEEDSSTAIIQCMDEVVQIALIYNISLDGLKINPKAIQMFLNEQKRKRKELEQQKKQLLLELHTVENIEDSKITLYVDVSMKLREIRRTENIFWRSGYSEYNFKKDL